MRKWEGHYRNQLIRQAHGVGPYTVEFIQRLWDQAALEIYWNSLEVFQWARWHSAQRVERAIHRALSYGLTGLTGLRFILEQELDRLPICSNADVAGQRVFPFMQDQGRGGYFES
jgi:hypothetical protein